MTTSAPAVAEPTTLHAVFCPEFMAEIEINEEQRLRLYKSMTGYFIGLVPLQDFFDRFFPGVTFFDGNRVSGDYQDVLDATREKDMYEPWVRLYTIYIENKLTYEVFELVL